MRSAFLLLLATALASPTPSLPGRTPLRPANVREIERLARTINTAYCPRTHLDEPSSQFRFGIDKALTNVLVSSEEANYIDDEAPEINWYISHSPSTGVISLAFSSLPSVDDFVDSLADDVMPGIPPVLPLPTYMYPSLMRPTSRRPRVHTAFLPALESHGAAALTAMMDVLDSPPPVSLLASLKGYFMRPTTKVEITGHGLGAATALLVSAALRLSAKHVTIDVTLFSLPRVGDAEFSAWLTDLTAKPGYTLRRIASATDAIPHLPPRSMGFTHPKAVTEVIIGETTDVCITAAEDESPLCAEAVKVQDTHLDSHSGPFGNVWITPACEL